MDGLRDHHKESKSDTQRQILYDTTYIWKLKYDTTIFFTKQKYTHRHRKQIYGY